MRSLSLYLSIYLSISRTVEKLVEDAREADAATRLALGEEPRLEAASVGYGSRNDFSEQGHSFSIHTSFFLFLFGRA
jgi:hypothetical protein